MQNSSGFSIGGWIITISLGIIPWACSSSEAKSTQQVATGGAGFVVGGPTGGQANGTGGSTGNSGGTPASTTPLQCPALATNPSNCPSNISTQDYHITSQVEIEMLAGYTEIGDFVVNMSSITNFAALRCLQRVNGRFEITDNDSLTSLDGLQNLREVTTWVDIESNPNMKMDCGLRKLSKVGATALTPAVDLNYNASLERIELTLLDSSAGHFRAHDNAALTEIIGSPTMAKVGQFWIVNNNALTSVTGFTGLTTVNDFEVANNDKLPFCQVQALAIHLSPVPATFINTGNLGTTCP